MNNNPDYNFSDYLNGTYYLDPTNSLNDVSTVFYYTANQPEPQGLYYDIIRRASTPCPFRQNFKFEGFPSSLLFRDQKLNLAKPFQPFPDFRQAEKKRHSFGS